MATPTQAQLALERDAIQADIADKRALYADLVARGKINSAQEVLGDINKLQGQERTISSDIKNYTQFSAERANQDAEIASTRNFEEKNSPANQTITSTSSTTSTTGGTQTSITAGAQSLTPDAENAAKQANLRASAFTANPNGKFGNGTIDKAVSSGAITADEAAALKAGAIPESERNAIANSARQSGIAAVNQGTVTGPTTTTATPTPNSSTDTTVSGQAVATPPTVDSNSNPNSNSTIVTNEDGTRSEVTVDNANATVTNTPLADSQLAQSTETTIVASQNVENSNPESIDPKTDPNTNDGAEAQDTGFEPLQEPPSTADEFDGIDQQVADNENGLKEPPVLSDEEVNAYLNQTGEEQENVADSDGNNGSSGSQGAVNGARSSAANQDAVSFEKAKDWRVRLSLAPNAKYLYKAGNPGILKPLAATNGVIFPYTPTVNVVYSAAYDAPELTHSNYKIYNYKNSSVDTVSITGDFTAQDTNEANYLLAVIHFFKSVTKMFYGQDQNPRNGVPPPLVYMSGLGTLQFDNHPLAVTNFTYSLPNEVDYIRAGSQTNQPGGPLNEQKSVNNNDNASLARIQSSGLGARVPNFQRQQSSIDSDATYVPTKMQIAITCIPIVTRNDISNNFSLEKYATGALLQGSKRNGGGIW